ncbi:MAG: CcmD family protein [Deltaproteobacteria bacterium]|jgi:CcmD family protein|nr:CcmD family protein [Deltaproteobacteria bacterium]
MDKASWLTYAFALVWIGLGAYITALLLRLRGLELRLRLMEEQADASLSPQPPQSR